MSRVPLLAFPIALALTACWGNDTTTFPQGLEPLETNTAPEQQGGTPTETLAMVTGKGHSAAVDKDYDFVHGRGYIHATPAAVWALTKDGNMLSATCRINSRTVTENDEPQYEYSFKVHNVVNDTITVTWDELWRFGTIMGTPDAPELSIVRYQKTYGSEFIYLIEGSIEILSTDDPNVTELQFIEHVAAVEGGTSDIEASMTQRFNAILAEAHGGTPAPCP